MQALEYKYLPIGKLLLHAICIRNITERYLTSQELRCELFIEFSAPAFGGKFCAVWFDTVSGKMILLINLSTSSMLALYLNNNLSSAISIFKTLSIISVTNKKFNNLPTSSINASKCSLDQ